MMTIGELAQVSGLSVSALRFYDDKGLLEPAQVDPDTGYRWYGGDQVRRAVTIALLREMGMSLTEVAEVADHPDRREELVAAFRERLTAERDRQDAAIRTGLATLASYDQPAAVRHRTATAQPWVGAVLSVEVTDDAAPHEEEYDRTFGRLWRALDEAGLRPSGPFWSSFRAGDTPTAAALVLCWPVPAPVPADFAVDGLRLVSGVLPERTEAFVRMDVGDPEDDQPAGSAPHRGFLALLEHLEEAALAGGAEVRQVGVLDDSGMPVAIDLVVTVPTATR